jgi:hypothetical protein
MSVHRETLPSGRRVYRVRWRDGDRNRSRSFERRADAEQFDADERRRQRMGAHAPAEPSRDRLDPGSRPGCGATAWPGRARRAFTGRR